MAAAEAAPATAETQEAQPGTGNAGSTAASAVKRRGAGDLAEVMRRRRDVCEEFESVPSSSTADAAAAEVPSAESEPAAQAEVEGLPPRGPQAWAPRRSRHTTELEFQNWMEQMRGRCQALESEQVAVHVADAHCEGVPSRPPAPVSETSADAAEAARMRHTSTSTLELQDWMARMRARCQILESTPNITTADARHEPTAREGDATLESPPSPARPSRPPARSPPSPPLAASAVPEEPKPAPAVTSAELLALRLRIRDGTPLTPAERLQVWPSLLLQDPASPEGEGRALPALAHLLGASGGAGAVADEDILFDATASKGEFSSAALCNRLSVAFSEKYVSPLSGQAGSGDDETAIAPVYAALAQLLRYHFPATSCAIETISVPAGFTLPEVLGVVFGGPAGLAQCLLTPHGGGEADALLLFCDLVVMEEEETLLLLAAAVLLSEVRPEPGTTFEHVKELIRSKRGLGGLGSRGVTGVCQCVAAARAMLDDTPVSLSSALSAGGRGAARLRLPMCAVAPDEALHHIYERPSGSWRLVVVDVRMRASQRALPVCMRLGQTQHNQRRQMLRELPYEESIHLCLLGDGPAIPGDDAFELCRHLVSPSVQRKHISVVDGGWPAVEELAESLRLHLMPLEPEEQPGSRSSLREARASVAELAGQVASATETATAAGQKMAQRVLKGARGAAMHLLGAEPSPKSAAPEATMLERTAGRAK
mmetsp:Transcript_30899/g.91833  ORF Transcript_30899/g.91833 Transcript_30899/m.91833 type:complete len:713 (-) Transcript_30899:29-2167(-)